MRLRRTPREPYSIHAAPVWDYPRPLPEMTQGPGREALDWNVRWPRRSERFMRVHVGVDAEARPLELELKARHENGHGPHVLCVGDDGRGKTAFLRTTLIGLADRYSPDRVQFVIAAAGDDESGMHLPHVSSTVAGLAEPADQPDRFARAIDEEIWRRGRLSASALAEEPALVLLADDVDRIIAARPAYRDLLDEIGRVGERIGMHLLLSAADPSGLDALPCLRVQLGKRDAALGGRRFRMVAYTREHLRQFAGSFMFYHHPVRTIFDPPPGLTVERMRSKDETGGSGVSIGLVASGIHLGSSPGSSVPLGPFDTVRIDFARRSHLLIVGDPGCGRTTAVQTVLRGLSDTPSAHGVVALDARGYYAVQRRLLAELSRRAADQDGWRGPAIVLDTDSRRRGETPIYLERLEALLRLGRRIGLHVIATAETGTKEASVFQALEEDDVTRIELSGKEAHERRWDTVGSRYGQPGHLHLTPTPVGRARFIGDFRCDVQIAVDAEATSRPPQFRPSDELFTVEDPTWSAPVSAEIGTTPDGEPFRLDVRGHVWCGGTGTSALLRKIAFSLAGRYSPAEVQFVVTELEADALADTAALPHTAHHAVITAPEDMRRLSAILDEEIRRRLTLEQEGKLASAPALVVLVNRAGDPETPAPALVHTLDRIAGVGDRLRVWLVLAEPDRPSSKLLDVYRRMFNRVSLSHSSLVDIYKRLRGNDVDVMIWFKGRRHLVFSTDLVRVGREDDVFVFHQAAPTAAEIRKARSRETPPAPPLGQPQGFYTYDDLLRDAAAHAEGDNRIPIGVIDGDRERPYGLDFEADRHFVVAGPPGSGRSTVLRTVLRGIARRYTSQEAAVVLLRDDDIGHALPERYVLARSAGVEPPERMVVDVMTSLRRRIDIGLKGPRLFLVIDDFERFDTEHYPLLALRDVLPHAEEIGLHLVLAGNQGIVGRRDVYSLQAAQLVLRDAPVPGSKLGETPALPEVGRGELLPADVRLRLPWNGRTV